MSLVDYLDSNLSKKEANFKLSVGISTKQSICPRELVLQKNAVLVRGKAERIPPQQRELYLYSLYKKTSVYPHQSGKPKFAQQQSET